MEQGTARQGFGHQMRIGFYLSTMGGSPLESGLRRGLDALGHAVEDYQPGRGYDLVLVFNQSAHTPGYCYPPFPEGAPFCFIDTAEYGYFTRLPDRVHRYATVASEGARAHDTKNRAEQERLVGWLEGKSFPYFQREYSKYIPWPAAYHPIDYPLYHLSACDRHPDREEYLARSLELYCSWGASHPWRMQITDALRAADVRAEIGIIDLDGHERMPQAEYFARTEAARCSVSYDGYGSGSFRMTEILCRTLLLQGPLSIELPAPLVDGETCVEYAVQSGGETFFGTDIAAQLRWVLEAPEEAYRIYAAGYEHCMTHMTERATAEYLLRVVEAHDWDVPTPLDLGA